MQYLRILITAIFLFTILSCSGDNSTDPMDPRDGGDDGSSSNVAVSIGNEGGSVGNDSFKFEVPENSFNSTSDISLETTETASGFNAVSKTYRIDGIPTDYTQPITIRIKPSESGGSNPQILFEYDNYIKSRNAKGDGIMFLDAQLKDGYFVAEIPAAVSSGRPKLAKSLDDPALADYVKIGGKFTAVVQAKSFVSNNGHFKIHYNSLTPDQDVYRVAQNLEDAYDKIEDLGFDFSRRTRWPISVSLKALGAENYGAACLSIFGINYSSIKINVDNLSQVDEIQTGAAHELMHIVQDFYDWFSWKHLWLDEATAVWFEELNYTGSKDYVSSAMEGNFMSSLSGIGAISQMSSGSQQSYGYGLAPMIKFIVEREGASVVREMYGYIEAGYNPVGIIDVVTSENISYWIDDFFDQYIMGEIMSGVTPGFFITDSRTEDYPVEHVYIDDQITDKYSDVSGKLFNFTFNYDVHDDRNYKLFLEPQWAHINLYKYKGSYIERMGSYPGSLTVKDLNSFVTDKYGILALVFNGIHNVDFTGGKNITLKMATYEMEDVLDFTKFTKIEFKLDTRYGEDDYVFFISLGDINIDSYYNGSFTGSGGYDPGTGDNYDNVEIEGYVNTETLMITSFKAVVKGYQYGDETIERFECSNIPFAYYSTASNKAYFEANGSAACDKLDSYYFHRTDEDGNTKYEYTYGNIWCDQDSDIEIQFIED